MEFSRQEEKSINEAYVQAEAEIIQLQDIQLAVIGGGVADITFS